MQTSLTPKRRMIEARLQRGDSLRAIARDLGMNYQTLQYHRRRWGCEPLRKAHTTGAAHASWRGGTFIDRWGYKMVRAPLRDCANPYTPEHVLIAEQMIGRRLKHGQEHVHHLNGDKADNRPANLLVCTKSRHRELHRQLETIGYQLIRSGHVVFNGSEYVLNSPLVA